MKCPPQLLKAWHSDLTYDFDLKVGFAISRATAATVTVDVTVKLRLVSLFDCSEFACPTGP